MASHRRRLNRQPPSSRCFLSSVFFFFRSSLYVNCYHDGDILKHDGFISGNATLVSAGGKFELRFFTTMRDTISPKTFVGICYHQCHRDTVVWVANRDNPLPRDFIGVFRIAEDGNLKVLDTNGTEYWSTQLENSSPSTNRNVKLMDSGNLVLSDDHMARSLWESFKYPTDTFLAGMKMDENLTLTSWQDDEDPRSGLYTFKLDTQAGEGYYVVSNRSQAYWKNGMSGKFKSSDELPYAIADLLTNFSLSIKNESQFQQKDNKTAVLTDRNFTFSR